MIVLFTDFGIGSPYVGQMRAKLHHLQADKQIIALCSDLAPFHIQEAAYFLAAYTEEFSQGTIFIGVVDPGVGGIRKGVILCADDQWFVGPDNGLFAVVARRANEARWWHITWEPDRCSASFHGRDIFAPVASFIAKGCSVDGFANEIDDCEYDATEWPNDLDTFVYVDGYGNLITGRRACTLQTGSILKVNGAHIAFARTFSDKKIGEPFWYENANGLVEIAVNQGSAQRLLNVQVGDKFSKK